MTSRRRVDSRPSEVLDLFASEAPPRPPARLVRNAAESGERSARAVAARGPVVRAETIAASPTLDDAPGVIPGAELEGAYGGPIPGASPASAIGVATLTQTAKELVEGAFMPLWVRGEVSDFKAHRNGHWYFCLRDETSQVRCVVWSRDARRLPATPDDGMQIVALGQPTVYAARGDLQLVVRAIDARGDGLSRKALERTRAALDAEGLFDPSRKRRLPRLPRRVAVVTSPDGAALHDIVAVVRRRCPGVEVIVVPAKVQGEGAADELRAAVERVARWGGADLVVIGRGGGSREDLWAFNDEQLARAVAACPIPTISAVGHEVDITICDLVADVRAATPSVAAESAVPVLRELREEVRQLGDALAIALVGRTTRAREAVDRARAALSETASRNVDRRRTRVETLAARLHALSPLATLSRGYAVARAPDGRGLARVADFAPGAPFDLLVADGSVRATALATQTSVAS